MAVRDLEDGCRAALKNAIVQALKNPAAADLNAQAEAVLAALFDGGPGNRAACAYLAGVRWRTDVGADRPPGFSSEGVIHGDR